MNEGSLNFDLRKHKELVEILLKDQTTKKNILWATDDYSSLSPDLQAEKEINIHWIINSDIELIIPRVLKNKNIKKTRTKTRAEVFTPTFIINKQVSLIDAGIKSLSIGDYVNVKWLEITCGEAPYVTTRYDVVTGEPILIDERVGFLDRKLQRINKEIQNEEEWYKYVVDSYKASYAYEYHGDSLFIARTNLMYTFLENYIHKFSKTPSREKKLEIAEIISFNLFQMDGVTNEIPYTDVLTIDESLIQLNLFDDLIQNDIVFEHSKKAKRTTCTVMDWDRNIQCNIDTIKRKEEIDMKFDVVIGNPPYQENIEHRGEQPPLYHVFYDSAAQLGKQVVFISPARFLFNVGQTPKKWNKKMLTSEHFKVIEYFEDSKEVFDGVDIKGGVAICLFDNTRKFEPIGTFVPQQEVKNILEKVNKRTCRSLGEILYSNTSYRYKKTFFEENPGFYKRVSGGSRRYLTSSVFSVFPESFHTDAGEGLIKIYGRENSQRTHYYFDENYLLPPDNFDYYKVFLASSNGSGKMGEKLSDPILGKPKEGSTETFISFGKFKEMQEAENLIKYLKTKFARLLLSTKKVTQGNKTFEVWSNVPLEDFSDKSDINWDVSISQIDKQLFDKYGFNDEEKMFILKNVLEME